MARRSGAPLADAGEVDEAPRQARQGARLGAPVGVVGRLVATGELPRGELLRDGGLHVVAGRVDLGGRRHQALLDLGDGALREHREAAQRLDRVAPELDAHGIAGRRVDVDDAAAHGELAALAHLLGALVAQAGDRGEHLVEGRLGALDQGERARLQVERDEALEGGDGVGDDHAAVALERGERPLALTEHVRRRRHVGAVEHAARRQRLDVAFEVGGKLGRQARRLLGVGHDHEPAGGVDRADQRRPARRARRSSGRRATSPGATRRRPW